MKNIKYLFHILFLSFLFSSCEQEVLEKYEPKTPEVPETVTPTAGDADFTKYVAVGNSLTAGYMNGALYNDGQENSLAALLAKQFALAGGGAFNQPDINSQHGYFGLAPDGQTILGRLRLSAVTNAPAPIVPGEAPKAFEGIKASLNNFGVPGVTLGTALIPQTGGDPSHPAFNPLYARFASNPGTSTIIGDAATALANGGSFFTFWLGNNDVLGYAVGGASNPSILTSVQDFQDRYQMALGAMLQAKPDAKGMIANIPNVIDVPFFKTVPYAPVSFSADKPEDLAAIKQLNDGYAQYNGAISAYNAGMLPGQTEPPSAENQRPTINFAVGNNGIVIIDESLPDLSLYEIPSYRQTTETDYVLLTAGSVIGTDRGNGPRGLADPLEDQFILVPTEQEEIQTRINDFNNIISAVATANTERIGLVDINAFFKQFAQTGYVGDNIYITAALAPPFGAFSLDGVHPNSRGYAHTANEFIRNINAKFGSTLPFINIASLPANDLPQ